MALADLLRALEAEAADELERRRAAAEAEAQAVLADASRQADELEARLAHAGDEAVRAEAGALLASARLEAAATVRSAREDAVRGVLEALRARLAALRDDPRWPDVLAALLAEARGALPGATAVVVDPRDLELAASLAPDLDIRAGTQGWGGVELLTDDGRRLDGTLAGRLRAAEDALRRRILERLEAPTVSAAA
jgi:V/A-type H+-transporting ATPase subunit E